jgi:hypothetical protein
MRESAAGGGGRREVGGPAVGVVGGSRTGVRSLVPGDGCPIVPEARAQVTQAGAEIRHRRRRD